MFLQVSISCDYQQMGKNYISNLVYNLLGSTSDILGFLRQHKETEDKRQESELQQMGLCSLLHTVKGSLFLKGS